MLHQRASFPIWLSKNPPPPWRHSGACPRNPEPLDPGNKCRDDDPVRALRPNLLPWRFQRPRAKPASTCLACVRAKPASATARPSLCEAHAQPSRASETGVSSSKRKTGGRGIAHLVVVTCDLPTAPCGVLPVRACFGARDPRGPGFPLGFDLVLPLAAADTWPGGIWRVVRQAGFPARRKPSSGLPWGFITQAGTSPHPDRRRPSPDCRCAPRLPSEGTGSMGADWGRWIRKRGVGDGWVLESMGWAVGR